MMDVIFKFFIRISIWIICSITGILFIGCTEKEQSQIPVESIKLSHPSLKININEEAFLTVTITPSNATNKNVSWSTSNQSVASVQDGKVTAHKAGKATITVTTSDGNKTATCEVTVVAYSGIPVSDITLDKMSIELKIGDKFTLTATIYPENATNKNVIWNSSDPSIASVQKGLVVAHNVGMTVITVTTENSNMTASCEIHVTSNGTDSDNENVGENDGIW